MRIEKNVHHSFLVNVVLYVSGFYYLHAATIKRLILNLPGRLTVYSLTCILSM